MKYLGRFGAQYGLNAKKLSQQWDNINPELELKRNQQREMLGKRYDSKRIFINALLFGFSLIIIFALFTIILIFD